MDFIVLAIRILIILNGSFVKNSPYSHQRFLSAEAFSYSSRNTLPDNKGHRPRDELEEPKDHSWMLLPDDEDDKSSAQGLRRVHKSVPDDLLPTVPAAASGHGDGGHVYHGNCAINWWIKSSSWKSFNEREGRLTEVVFFLFFFLWSMYDGRWVRADPAGSPKVRQARLRLQERMGAFTKQQPMRPARRYQIHA